MKVVILAGGAQSTINNDYEGIPKPMVEVGGRPLLWHIMKHFSQYGLKEFIICGGYRVDMIKEYFMDYYIYASDITVDLQNNTIEIHKKRTEDWKVTVVDTGLDTTTGYRVGLVQKYVDGEAFIVSYGDCLSDIDVDELIAVHRNHKKIATMSLAKPTGRNLLLPMDEEGNVCSKQEKPIEMDSAWINADCYVFQKDVFQYMDEEADLEKNIPFLLAAKEELVTYKHSGFWNAIETRRDLLNVENLWNTGQAPWIKE